MRRSQIGRSRGALWGEGQPELTRLYPVTLTPRGTTVVVIDETGAIMGHLKLGRK